MSNGRQGGAGATRVCPHCRATILESAAICPGCKHHLRFEPGAARNAPSGFSALKVEGTIHHVAAERPWEYSVVLTIQNERGETGKSERGQSIALGYGSAAAQGARSVVVVQATSRSLVRLFPNRTEACPLLQRVKP